MNLDKLLGFKPTPVDAAIAASGQYITLLGADILQATPGTEEMDLLQEELDAAMERHEELLEEWVQVQPLWYRLFLDHILPVVGFIGRWLIVQPLNIIKRLAFLAAHAGRG